MYEVVYDEAAKPIILERFPSAQIEDASDEIHEGRFAVTLPDSERDAFYKHAIVEGYCEICLGFRTMMYDKKGREQIEKWCSELPKAQTKYDTSHD